MVKTAFWRQVLKVSMDLLSSGLEGAYSTLALVSFFEAFLSFSLGCSSAALATFVNFLSPKLKSVQLTPGHFFLRFL